MKMKKFCMLLLCFGIISCDDNSSTSSSKEGSELPEEVGSACTTSEYVVKCVGDTALSCKKEVVSAVDCSQISDLEGNALSCIIVNKRSSCDLEDGECEDVEQRTFDCVSKANKCSREGESYTQCETSSRGVSRNVTYSCTKAADGSLYIRESSSEKCYDGYGVCNGVGECTAPKTCSYENYCKGDVLYTCQKGLERIIDCSASSESCALIGNEAACRSTKKECNQEGEEVVVSCTNQGNEVIEICTKASNGKMYYVRSGTRKCLSGCNAEKTACEATACEAGEIRDVCREGYTSASIDHYACHEHDGVQSFSLVGTEACVEGYCSEQGECVSAPECQAKSFVSRCEGNTALKCVQSKEKAYRCDLSNSSNICDVVDGTATCYGESDICLVEGEEKVSSCNSEHSKEYLRVCKKAESGRLYWQANGNRDCPKGCNADKTACAE